MHSPLDTVVTRHKHGESVGITSICSAHPLVLQAAMAQAQEDGDLVLIEATSNQVDQTGGYTGMRPADFRDLVHQVADRAGLPRERVVLGGDHLGPNRWRSLPAAEAMAHADVLVAAYVEAGFTKIHLDCSYPCADDQTPLTDDVVARRAARLMRVAEDTATAAGLAGTLRYVIGTEVPVPGGADETIEELVPTTAEAARTTLARHRAAFAELGLDQVWPQVMALVVQPGVEFDHLRVVDYERDRTKELQRVLDDEPAMVFEAHSTDYQTVSRLTALVEDHWSVLKVGPGLTFALREALFALAAIEGELIEDRDRSHLPEVVEQRMLAEPAQWAKYYPGDVAERRLARRYSYSDRMRYYWPDPAIQAAERLLLANLTGREIPLPLLSQYLPDQYRRVRDGTLSNDPIELVLDRVRDVLRDYRDACTVAKGAGRMSDLLGHDISELRRRGAINTSREIAQQPTVWRQVSHVIAESSTATICSSSCPATGAAGAGLAGDRWFLLCRTGLKIKLDSTQRAAVDRDGDPGQVARGGGEHERGDSSELGRVTQPAHRDRRLRVEAGPLRVTAGGEELAVAVRHDPSGEQADEPDARGPNSSDISFATAAMPGRRPFEMPRLGIGTRTELDRTRPIAPPSGSAPATVRMARTVPRKTVSKDSRHCSSVTCAAEPTGGPPTEMSAPSSRPKCSPAASTRRCGVAGSASVAASPVAYAAPPSRSTAAATRPGSRAAITTLAPSATSCSAVASPSPFEAPVSRNTRSASPRSMATILPYGRWWLLPAPAAQQPDPPGHLDHQNATGPAECRPVPLAGG